jgi:hypothetical protein
MRAHRTPRGGPRPPAQKRHIADPHPMPLSAQHATDDICPDNTVAAAIFFRLTSRGRNAPTLEP